MKSVFRIVSKPRTNRFSQHCELTPRCKPQPDPSMKHRIAILMVVMGSFLCAHAENSAAPPEAFRNPELPLEQRVQDLISRLTLEEKALLLDHKGPTLERFNIRSDQWNQCLNGVQWDRPTTLFPTCIAMGATWDPALVNEISTALSDEARAIYNAWHQDPDFKGEKKGLIYRAPVINISRNPYWGRIHEVYSEDPYLTGRMAVAYVKGLQGDHPHYLKIAATLKHFAVNNVETDRQKLDARVPERWLREYWLPHFRDAIVEGKAHSVMASYSAINGTPNNINRWLLTDLLKNEWAHEGFVVSDLGGVRTLVQGHGAGKMDYVDAVARSVMAGCDFSDKEYAGRIPVAVRDGKITQERLDDALARVLRVRMKLGEFDPPDRLPWSKIPLDVIDGPAHRALALKAARQSIVLLENRKGFLPLDPGRLKRVAVIGPRIDRVNTNNYNGKFRNGVTALQGLKDRLPPDCEVTHTYGGSIGGKPHSWIKEPPFPELDQAAELQKAAELAKNADVAIVFVGTDFRIEHEARDRTSLALSGNQEELVKTVLAANPRTVVVLNSAGPLAVPWLKENVPAMLQAWWPGEEGGHAIADVLLGNAEPGGRLPYTIYASDSQVPPLDQYDVSKGFTYMYLNDEPLYPFGYGLGYTTTEFSDLKLSKSSANAEESLTATVTLENTGQRDGAEVIQIYAKEPAGKVVKPRLRLVAFQRVELKSGERRTVTIPVEVARMRYWDEDKDAFVADPGVYQLSAGASSENLPVSASFTIHP
jgi:beta-glucosidase